MVEEDPRYPQGPCLCLHHLTFGDEMIGISGRIHNDHTDSVNQSVDMEIKALR